ncbi:MAG: efflux transporter outer membrane subunit [Proteobacteria bacterium]|nr:efflux transporter outer membrane subunit [Pseudomonadota bacterium]
MNKKCADARPKSGEVAGGSAGRSGLGAASLALRALRAATALACLLSAGCTMGPDFKRPAVADGGDYAAHPLSATVATDGVAGGEAQRFVKGSDIAGDWWTLFHSRPLNELIEQSLANNADLKAVQAALSVARENTLAGRGVFYPTVSVNGSASRVKDPAGSLAPVPSNNASLYNLYTPQLSISYALDVFGLNRRTLESLQAQQQAVRFQMIAAQISLSTNVVAAAVQEASLRAQVDATRELVGINTHAVEVLRYQLAKGYAARLDLAAQEAQLAQVEAALPPLLKQLTQQQHLVAVLAGRFPNQAPTQNFELADLRLPQELPLSLPSELVAQRPDVLQAEATMHAASAQIGVATANRLPNISLTANVGSTALTTSRVFTAGTGFWNLATAITAPVFQGGTLLHQQRAAQAAYVEAAEQYRGTVLGAFQNVADTLTAIEQDAAGLKAAAAAAAAAKVTLELAQRQWRSGYASYLSLLGAEQAYQQARISLVQAQANRYVDTAALFQSLGGGWWKRDDLNQSH